MMVEELLKFLICVINTQLIERIEVKDFETCDIEDSYEKISRWLGRQLAVDNGDKPVEKAPINCFCDSFTNDEIVNFAVTRFYWNNYH